MTSDENTDPTPPTDQTQPIYLLMANIDRRLEQIERYQETLVTKKQLFNAALTIMLVVFMGGFAILYRLDKVGDSFPYRYATQPTQVTFTEPPETY